MRPVEYNSSILDKANEYLETCIDERYDWTKSDGAQSTSYEHRILVRLPSIEGLARYLSVARSTVYKWKEEYPEFSDILEEILAEQAERLISNGLSGDYNPTISKLILTKHGYSDKQEITGADGKDLMPTPILAPLNALQFNDGDDENISPQETNQGDSGRDISQQDNLDSADSDTSRTER